jgi:NAD(P)-dependent dehydrogenase (short-subunit alcohol dehydrogenase family)
LLSDKPLDGRIALVTGSIGDGIGRSAAFALARDGADVILHCSRRPQSGRIKSIRLVEREIQKLGRRAITIKADTESLSDVKRLFREAQRNIGPVDILVNNAGWKWLEQDVTKLKYRDWEKTIGLDLDGSFYCIKQALPHMRKMQWGRIINVGLDERVFDALLLGVYSHLFYDYPFAYISAKRGKAGLTHALAFSEYLYGVTINNIHPGIVELMSFKDALSLNKNPKLDQRDHATPTDVANVISFLASEAGKFITDSDIRVPANVYKILEWIQSRK